ncbi:hypothetical protein GPK86_01560 [Blautia faecis]|uniref:hypothetical protein n=1 Tax=Blautia faecis TaxID=871665 RepID=UPI001C0373A8|nr:hypothetical protein [Blautia faecis]MBT9855179.1 hypothetical protein [Blautia faecis]
MPDTIESPVLEVFSRWGAAVSKITGADNYSMDGSETNASGKKAYAQLYMLGNPIARGDLEGDEYPFGVNSSFAVYSAPQLVHCHVTFKKSPFSIKGFA